MANYKKISEFGNVTPVSTDLYLIEKVDGTYSYVTGNQLLTFFSGGGGGSQTLAQTLANGDIMPEGASIKSADGVNTLIVNNGGSDIIFDDGTNINSCSVNSVHAIISSEDGTDNSFVESKANGNTISSTVKNIFDAPNNNFPNETPSKIVVFDASGNLKSGTIAETDIATKSYADGLVAGLLDDRGSYNASTNLFPSTGGSGISGAILKGDIWYISVSGTLGGVAVTVGDSVRALVDTPAQTSSNWSVLETNIGYVPENVANKATTMTGNTTSNLVYLTAKAVYDWVISKITVNPKAVVFGATSGELTSDPKIFVDQYKCLVIGGNGSDSGQHEVTNPKPQLELVSNNENVQAFNMKTYGPLGGYPGGPETQNDLHFYRYDGTQSAPTNTKKDMFLMSAGFRGWGTQPTQSSVAIQVQASENWTDYAIGADFIIQTTPNGQYHPSRRSAFVAKNDQRIYLSKAHTTFTPYRTNCILNIDLINSVSTGSSLTVGQLTQHANTGSGSILIGAGTTDEFAIFHYGASLSTFNIAGSNFPAPTTTYFYGNSTATSPFYFGASKHAFAVGQTGTNPSMLLDAVGLKIGTVADVATSGTASLDLPASATTKASLRIRTGVAPTSPNVGDIYSDGTHIYCYLGGAWKQLDN